MSKVMSLHDAIAKYVESGDSLYFGGFTTNRKPYAAVYEIIRQGQNRFYRIFWSSWWRLGYVNRMWKN